MAYRNAGNDPNQSRTYQTPAEVKAMLTGGGGAPDYQSIDSLADLPEATGFHKTSGTPKEVCDEIMVWLYGERSLAASNAIVQGESRCGTCGRKFDCCCQGCPTCPQTRMAEDKISAGWAKLQVALGDTDPRAMC